ncbi:MAG: hypothetical protein EZS28_010298 [Streblomastix strix]|uniref:Uncharacterized protein n=1 Tax=Streblomastix strix TaxID=222440 RepID=A0A5J4WHI8_9EUKA|nr:MAG: hypothetical protein EZS28_010298 [Streblomastix strix]
MIPPEKPDIIYLLDNLHRIATTTTDVYKYIKFSVRIVNMACVANGTSSYRDHVQVGLTPITHYLCDSIVNIILDDNPDPQVLSLEVTGDMEAQ